MKIDLPDECFRTEGGRRRRRCNRERDGFDPVATPNKLSRGNLGSLGTGIYRKTRDGKLGFARDEEEAFQLRGNAVSKSTCVDRILDRLVSNIGNEEENERSSPLSYACKSIFPSSSIRFFCP